MHSLSKLFSFEIYFMDKKDDEETFCYVADVEAVLVNESVPA